MCEDNLIVVTVQAAHCSGCLSMFKLVKTFRTSPRKRKNAKLEMLLWSCSRPRKNDN
jgi:hypothetical protein